MAEQVAKTRLHTPRSLQKARR